MLECATALCIFSVALVIGVVIVQTARREGLTGGETNNSYFGVFEICQIVD